MDQEDENMSKPKGTDADEQTDDEDGLEDAHTHVHVGMVWGGFEGMQKLMEAPIITSYEVKVKTFV